MKPRRINPITEAERIEALLKTDLTRKLKTHDPIKLANFRSDGLKYAAHLRVVNLAGFGR